MKCCFKDLEIQKKEEKIHALNMKIRNLIKNEIKTISFERDLEHERDVEIKINEREYETFFKSDELTYAKQDDTRGNSYIETYNGNFFDERMNIIAYENMNKILSKDL